MKKARKGLCIHLPVLFNLMLLRSKNTNASAHCRVEQGATSRGHERKSDPSACPIDPTSIRLRTWSGECGADLVEGNVFAEEDAKT